MSSGAAKAAVYARFSLITATAWRLEKPRKRREAPGGGQKARRENERERKKGREKRGNIARREARATYNRVRSPRRQWRLITHTRGGHEDEEKEGAGEKDREKVREGEGGRRRDQANATHVETGRHVSTSNARPCGCTRRPGGRRCANGVEGWSGGASSLSFSLSIHGKRNQSGGGDGGSGDEKREHLYSGTRKGAFIT